MGYKVVFSHLELISNVALLLSLIVPIIPYVSIVTISLIILFNITKMCYNKKNDWDMKTVSRNASAIINSICRMQYTVQTVIFKLLLTLKIE